MAYQEKIVILYTPAEADRILDELGHREEFLRLADVFLKSLEESREKCGDSR